jgi:hypothetical protein
MTCTKEKRAIAAQNLVRLLGLTPENFPWLDHSWSVIVEINATIDGTYVQSVQIHIPDELADWWCNYGSLVNPPYKSELGLNSDFEILLSSIRANIAIAPPDNNDITSGLKELLSS